MTQYTTLSYGNTEVNNHCQPQRQGYYYGGGHVRVPP
jgi:hypothetical protein